MLNLNIHPLLVHFPIALLVVYSLLEWIPLKRLKSQSCWFYIKATFLFFGVLSTIPTGLAGKIIEGQFRDQSALVDLHSKFAVTSSAVYALLAGLYFLSWLKRSNNQIKFFLPTAVIIALSILGFFLILITGALGGVIVYGPNLDPFTAFIYHLFFQ